MKSESMKDYRLLTKPIIKWYEYTMDDGKSKEAEPEETSEETSEPEEIVEDTARHYDDSMPCDDEEEIDLATTGLDDADQALVLDIMNRFKEAKQSSVDSLFETSSEDPESNDDLIASICAPKQSNVDALVQEARDTQN